VAWIQAQIDAGSRPGRKGLIQREGRERVIQRFIYSARRLISLSAMLGCLKEPADSAGAEVGAGSGKAVRLMTGESRSERA